MIMADQDSDGSHIKGLLINLIHAWWPSLARLPGFLKEFFTPIVKARKGRTETCFYTLPEYEAWKKETDNGKGFKIKYYKGLGTSTPKEAKEYFSALESHKMQYRYDGVEDDRAIDLAFNKRRADDRKTWINAYEEGRLVDHTQREVSYKDFVDKELVLFAKANVARAIPSMVDGFKPSQRKVLFGCFKRKLRHDVKVAQLVGYVSEHAAYHHGEMSLSETIVGMAQDFVGSNNINLLVPQGQFGTRLQGGKDSASARYIYTRLAPITRCLFPASDDPVLEYLSEDGLSIEPRWYCPVIPMVLVNGVEGIGTGWSSSVPNFNPREIVENLRRWLKKQEMKEMSPWFAGFTGSISKGREEGKWEATPALENIGDRFGETWGDSDVSRSRAASGKAEITELPVKRWTQDYREILEENLPKGEKKREGPKLLEDYQEYHSEKTVHFELSLSSEGQLQAEKDRLSHSESFGDKQPSSTCDNLQALKLRSSISMNNMMLFDADGKIKKYETAKDILQDFAEVRLRIYEKRKAYLLARLTRECEVLSAKARFVKLVIEGKIVIRRRRIADLAQDLRKNGFKALQDLQGQPSEDKEEGHERVCWTDSCT
ncbi:TOP2 [Symbiodinium natans]|uniref:DNA topoisomerase (ATP-hydrolyzing) n=1 Tax=Symbiodinium natans TaxID=878477 RepID=A0A812IFY5_9DINO|nr:TOP2 [Symbiodinium natans]